LVLAIEADRGNGAPCKQPADFDWFGYYEREA
jgi:hypothetical protein